LCHRRETLNEEISRCAHIFAWALPRDEKPFSDLSLVAFADAMGIFSLLGRECNVGTVVNHNADGSDLDDVRVIAKALGSPVDHYVFGDLEDLDFVMDHREIPCDVFVSRSGLDLIDGIGGFFDTVSASANGAISFGLGFDKSRSLVVEDAPEQVPGAIKILRSFDRLVANGFQVAVLRGSSTAEPRHFSSRVRELAHRFLPLNRAHGARARRGESLVLAGFRTARGGAPARVAPADASPSRALEPQATPSG
jgi:hypothetical protein